MDWQWEHGWKLSALRLYNKAYCFPNTNLLIGNEHAATPLPGYDAVSNESYMDGSWLYCCTLYRYSGIAWT